CAAACPHRDSWPSDAIPCDRNRFAICQELRLLPGRACCYESLTVRPPAPLALREGVVEMNKKIASSKRLQLNKETLRSLTGAELSQVQGASGACAIAVGGSVVNLSFMGDCP